MLKQKLKYLTRSILNSRQVRVCPYCGGADLQAIDRKYYFTVLLGCQTCGLNHRHPKDDPKRLKKFYQQEYAIDTHMITKLPSDDEITSLMQENFPSLRNYDDYIQPLFQKKVKVLDYGCSWGYDVFKLKRSGHEIADDHNTIYVNTEGVIGQVKRLSSGVKAFLE